MHRLKNESMHKKNFDDLVVSMDEKIRKALLEARRRHNNHSPTQTFLKCFKHGGVEHSLEDFGLVACR